MKKEVFTYLNKDYRYLNNYVRDMKRLVIKDPKTAVKKGKDFATHLSKEVVRMENLNALSTMTQDDRLKLIRSEASINDEVLSLFNTIKILGNDSSRSTEYKDLEISLKVHKAVHQLTYWFVEKYINSELDVDDYKNPITDLKESRVENPTEFEDLMSKMENLLNN